MDRRKAWPDPSAAKTEPKLNRVQSIGRDPMALLDRTRWEHSLTRLQAEVQRDRLDQFEAILNQVATGVFILEPTVRSDPYSLEVTVVNDMGAKFFGDIEAEGVDILRAAEN